MSLAIDLTNNHTEIEKAEREVSALLRQYKSVLPAVIYNELQLKLCVIASECTKLKGNLGSLRMIGEMAQRPAAVTVETLELAAFVPMLPEHPIRDEREAFALQLRHIGDDTLSERGAA